MMRSRSLNLRCWAFGLAALPALHSLAQNGAEAPAAPPPSVTPLPPAADPADADDAAALGSAWSDLAAGRLRAAEQAFLALAAEAPPQRTGPLLGAGLAAAALGDVKGAARRLQAVLARGGTAGLEHMPASEALAERVRQARTRLEEDLLEADDPASVLLSAAFLDHLVGEDRTARLSLDAAIRRGGLTQAARHLDERLRSAEDGGDGDLIPSPLRNPEVSAAAVSTAEPSPASEAADTPAAPEATVAESPAPPLLRRPGVRGGNGNEPEAPGAARVFLDYQKLNLRVSEMAGSLERFEQKLLDSLLRAPAALPPADPAASEPSAPSGSGPEASVPPAAPQRTP